MCIHFEWRLNDFVCLSNRINIIKVLLDIKYIYKYAVCLTYLHRYYNYSKKPITFQKKDTRFVYVCMYSSHGQFTTFCSYIAAICNICTNVYITAFQNIHYFMIFLPLFLGNIVVLTYSTFVHKLGKIKSYVPLFFEPIGICAATQKNVFIID